MGAGIGDDHDPNSGGVGGCVAGAGVFKGEALSGLDVEISARGEVNIGGGFWVNDVVAAVGALKKGGEAEALEMAVDVIVKRVGRDGQRKADTACVLEEFENAREDGLVFDDLVFIAFKPSLEGGDVSRRTERLPRVVGDAGMSDDLLSCADVELESGIGVHLRPSGNQGSFGVEDETVEIEMRARIMV